MVRRAPRTVLIAVTFYRRWASKRRRRREQCGCPGIKVRSSRISRRWRGRFMTEARNGTIYYKKSRFITHLPEGRLYTRSHYWLFQAEPAGVWRIGMTKFANRMLGDIVEFGFNVQRGAPVEVGQAVGWMEGFKAISDIYCVAKGEFVRANPALDADITLLDTKPYGEGWLY